MPTDPVPPARAACEENRAQKPDAANRRRFLHSKFTKYGQTLGGYCGPVNCPHAARRWRQAVPTKTALRSPTALANFLLKTVPLGEPSNALPAPG
jgi:hypothetical protein